MRSFSILQMGRGSALNKRLFASFLLYHKTCDYFKTKSRKDVIRFQICAPSLLIHHLFFFFFLYSIFIKTYSAFGHFTISNVEININKLRAYVFLLFSVIFVIKCFSVLHFHITLYPYSTQATNRPNRHELIFLIRGDS